MGPSHETPLLHPQLRNSPAWWIGTLERALAARDYDLVRLADGELARLGWIVVVRPGPKEEGHDGAR